MNTEIKKKAPIVKLDYIMSRVVIYTEGTTFILRSRNVIKIDHIFCDTRKHAPDVAPQQKQQGLFL